VDSIEIDLRATTEQSMVPDLVKARGSKYLQKPMRKREGTQLHAAVTTIFPEQSREPEHSFTRQLQ